MICLLCLAVERDEQLLNITSTESRHHNVPFILYTHFRICFQEEPMEGFVCQKCWIKVSVFHEFYTQVEYVHRTNESIFVENIIGDMKPNLDAGSDPFTHLDDSPIDDNTEQYAVKAEYHQQSTSDYKPETQAPSLTTLKDDNDDSDDGMDNFDLYFTPPTPTPAPKADKPKKVKKTKQPEGHVKRKLTKKTPTKEYKKQSNTFQCKTCELHFLTYSRLSRHIKETHDLKEFKCADSKCVDSFDTQQLLDDHVATKHKRAECPHCKKTVLDSFLAKHIENRHGTGHVVCELCGKLSLNKQMHKEHYKATHEVVQKLQCDICAQWFKNRVAIRSHMTKHIYGPQKCEICGHLSPNRKALIEHKRLHKPGTKDRWKCDVCGRGFRERKKLEEHYHIHTGTAGSHHCDECGKIFRFSSSFSVHRKKMHPK